MEMKEALLLPLGILAGEELLKNRMEKTLREGETKPVLNGRLLLRRYHNRGAALNLGESRPERITALSLGLTAALCVLYPSLLSSKNSRSFRLGCALLLGGACSNTLDRLKRGYVVDYFSLNVRWPRLREIVFNLADFCIFAGTALAAWEMAAGAAEEITGP